VGSHLWLAQRVPVIALKEAEFRDIAGKCIHGCSSSCPLPGRAARSATQRLAGGTVMRRASAHHDARDRGATGIAGLPGPPEDLQIHVWLALPALDIHVLAETRPAVGDTPLQPAAGRRCQPLDSARIQAPRGRKWVNTRPIERLI